jgi:hypothetical protein
MAAQLVASRVVLSSTELVSYLVDGSKVVGTPPSHHGGPGSSPSQAMWDL